MALADLTSPDAVLRALEEFDRLGREEFLARHGFEKARRYFVVRNGQRYDSKAIAGVAHGYQHPELGPLRAGDFSGGDATVRARLEALGFDVVVNEPPVGPVRPLRLLRGLHSDVRFTTSLCPISRYARCSSALPNDSR